MQPKQPSALESARSVVRAPVDAYAATWRAKTALGVIDDALGGFHVKSLRLPWNAKRHPLRLRTEVVPVVTDPAYAEAAGRVLGCVPGVIDLDVHRGEDGFRPRVVAFWGPDA
jgi:hypothetical protein